MSSVCLNPTVCADKLSPEYPVSIPQDISDEDVYKEIVESIKRDGDPSIDYNAIINFKRYFGGRHVCVMCGRLGGKDCTIRSQNKEVCSDCDSKIWLCMEDSRRFKFCKGCKNFYSMCSFGDKPLASKCIKCRQRSRRHYSLQKTASVAPSPCAVELMMHSPQCGLQIDTTSSSDGCEDCEGGGSSGALDNDRCTPPITKWRAQSDQPDIDAVSNKAASRPRVSSWGGKRSSADSGSSSGVLFSPESPSKDTPTDRLPPIVHALLSPTTALKGVDAANDSLLMLSSVLKSEILSPVSVKPTFLHHHGSKNNSDAIAADAFPLLKRKLDGSISSDCVDSPVKQRKIELVLNQDTSFCSLISGIEGAASSPSTPLTTLGSSLTHSDSMDARSMHTGSSSLPAPGPVMAHVDQRWQWDASSNPLMYFATILAEASSE